MKILKLQIENFKGVKARKTIDFSKSLTLLRGPNGFGKTTIFDAIELCLTGSIKRIVDKAKVTKDTKDYSDAFYRNTPNKDVILKLLLENTSGERVVIAKYLPFDHDGNFGGLDSRARKYKVIDSLEKLPTYILTEGEFDSEDFYTTHSPEENYEEKIQQIIFGSNTTLKTKDIYKLFGYIQQEENTFYLDLSETERRDELDFLYNSQEQVREIDELGKNIDQLKKAEDALKNELQNLSTEQKTSVKNSQIYQRVFDYIQLEFDQEDPFAKEGPRTIDANYRSTVDYIQRIKHFTDVFDFSAYQSSVKKKTLNSLARNNDFQQYFILRNFLEDEPYQKVINDFNLSTSINETSIAQYYILQNFLANDRFAKIKQSASSYALAAKYFAKEYVTAEERLEAIIGIEDKGLISKEQIEAGKSSLQQLRQSKKLANTTSTTLASIAEIRGRLAAASEHLNKNSDHSTASCPFCGYDWQGYNELRQSIEAKSKEFERLTRDQANSIAKQNQDIEKDYLTPIEKHLREFMAHNERGYRFYQKLRTLKDSISNDDFLAFARRLESIVQDAGAYIWSEIKSREELSEQELALRSKVNSAIAYDSKVINKLQQLKGLNFDSAVRYVGQVIPKEMTWNTIGTYEKFVNDRDKLGKLLSDIASKIEIDQEKLGGSDANFFKDIFLEKPDNIKDIAGKLDGKLDYITLKYSQKKSLLYELLSTRYTKIKAIRSKVNSLRNDYKTTVIEYKNTMTDAVKIPFHIYSARILQNYSQGYGAFIDTPSQSTSSIRFSAGSGSDHDLVHQLSSGQLAVVSMAFSLAINKVYGSASLRFLAIDDPVQELDALNVYSFVELLRNDFSENYQLLLSTHDELHADYIGYKFDMDTPNVRSIKVQELFFPATNVSASEK